MTLRLHVRLTTIGVLLRLVIAHLISSLYAEDSANNSKELFSARPHSDTAVLRFLESIVALKDEDLTNIRLDTDATTLPSTAVATTSTTDDTRRELITLNYQKALGMRKSASGTEALLYRTLLDPVRYEKNVRPTLHHTLPTNITFGVLLNQIVEMDERNQVLTTRCWINSNWLDRRLSWNESDWGGIKQIYIPHKKIWKPDIILVNNAAREYHGGVLSTDIMVDSKGNVTWLFSALLKSNCAIKVRYYPFDDQECSLRFASWGSHDMNEIDIGLTTEKGDLSNYMNNSEFDLIDMRAMRTVIRFPTDTETKWPMIVILIRVHRRPLFYVFNHILPCVLISSMALLGFLMPPETGEKINMLNTVILSMGVYLQSITESIPPTSEAVPLIGLYYVASLFIVCLATTVNVLTLNIHRSGAANQGRAVPWWMQKYILGYMATALMMRIREPDSVTLLRSSQAKQSTIRRSSLLRDLKRIKNTENRRGPIKSRDVCECLTAPLSIHNHQQRDISSGDERSAVSSEQDQHLTAARQSGDSAFLNRALKEQVGGSFLLMPRMAAARHPVLLREFEERFRKILKRAYRTLQQHEIREEILDERQRIMWQWEHLAKVLDRLLLMVFTMATVATVLIFLVLPVTFRDDSPLLV